MKRYNNEKEICVKLLMTIRKDTHLIGAGPLAA